MRYDPEKHHRRSIRWKDYDYSRCGAYFVTVCTQERLCLFGDVDAGNGIERCRRDDPPNVVPIAGKISAFKSTHLGGFRQAPTRIPYIPARLRPQSAGGKSDQSHLKNSIFLGQSVYGMNDFHREWCILLPDRLARRFSASVSLLCFTRIVRLTGVRSGFQGVMEVLLLFSEPRDFRFFVHAA